MNRATTCRAVWLLGWTLACAGCGDDPQAEPSAELLLQQWVAEYDRGAAEVCICHVDDGDFPSMDECLRVLGTGPTWIDCAIEAADALALDEREGREHMLCAIDQLAATADCREVAACDWDAIQVCQEMPDPCPPLPPGTLFAVLEACPDFGLLSRLDGSL